MSERSLRSEDLLTHHASACAFRSASQRVRRGCWTLVIPISSRTGEPPSRGLRDGNGTPVAQHARYSDVRLPRLVGVRRARPRTRQFRRPSTLNTVERERALADLAGRHRRARSHDPAQRSPNNASSVRPRRGPRSAAQRGGQDLRAPPSRWRGAPHEVRVFGDQSPLRAPREPRDQSPLGSCVDGGSPAPRVRAPQYGSANRHAPELPDRKSAARREVLRVGGRRLGSTYGPAVDAGEAIATVGLDDLAGLREL